MFRPRLPLPAVPAVVLLVAGPAAGQPRVYFGNGIGNGYPGVYAGAGVPPAGFGSLSTYGYFGPPAALSPGVRNTGPYAFGPPGGYDVYSGYLLRSPALGVAPLPGVGFVPRSDPSGVARTEVYAPNGATVTLNGTPADAATGVRHFKSPPLTPNKWYTYKAVATWTENGKPVTREKTVDVQAGGRYAVDLTTP
jgi:uncharacterized protein (TIGR03000 family)